MKIKHLATVVAVLAVLAAITFFVHRPGPPPSADARVGQHLADVAILDRAARIRISDQGKVVLLAKQADGTWRVPGYYDLAVDFAKLSRFVGELTETRIQRLVTANPEIISRLEFKDTAFTFLDAADKELWAVTLGRNAENGGRFVRFGSEPKAYLVNLNTVPDTEVKNWADTQLLSLKPEDIARVEISFPDVTAPTVVAVRAKKEDPFAAEPPLPGKRLKADVIANLLNAVTGLRFSDTSEPADPNAVAAREHARTVKLTAFDGKSTTILIGRKPEEKIIKPAAPGADTSKSGPASLLSALQSERKETSSDPGSAPSAEGPAKALESVTETVPAGPVFAFVTSSEANAPINTLMQKRAFQIFEYSFTSLAQKADELFEAAPPP